MTNDFDLFGNEVVYSDEEEATKDQPHKRQYISKAVERIKFLEDKVSDLSSKLERVLSVSTHLEEQLDSLTQHFEKEKNTEYLLKRID